MNIPAIVLAAGASARLGQAKQLLQYEGETLLARAIRLAREGGAAPVMAILGANGDLTYPEAQNSGAIPIINEKWERGIAVSIQAGVGMVNMVGPNAPGVLLLTCDQPRLSAAHLTRMLGLFRAQPEPAIVASAYGGTLGTPVVFPRSVFPQLRALQGDTGARAILMNPPCLVREVPFAGGEIDIDTPADLENLT